MTFPAWLWWLIAILVVLGILYLVGVQFDVDAS
jgi:hypothetical protein